ncbi:MAG: hypothetical protein E6G89_14925, partial [Alphaproteobacteria bacterium]
KQCARQRLLRAQFPILIFSKSHDFVHNVKRHPCETSVRFTIGGGLCQLSNALYEAALAAGFEIVERHAMAVSLRVRAPRPSVMPPCSGTIRSALPFRIEAALRQGMLEVTLRGGRAQIVCKDTDLQAEQRLSANDCTSCAETACAPRHAWPHVVASESCATLVALRRALSLRHAPSQGHPLPPPIRPAHAISTGLRRWPAAGSPRVENPFCSRRPLLPARVPMPCAKPSRVLISMSSWPAGRGNMRVTSGGASGPARLKAPNGHASSPPSCCPLLSSMSQGRFSRRWRTGCRSSPRKNAAWAMFAA